MKIFLHPDQGTSGMNMERPLSVFSVADNVASSYVHTWFALVRSHFVTESRRELLFHVKLSVFVNDLGWTS